LTDAPWLLYFPIDGDIGGDRLPPSWVDMLKQVDIPVAMSIYGQRVARTCGIQSEYIPHGVDLSVFSPPEDREAAKARLGYGGKFVILCDSRNQPRKMLPRLLDVFARFAADRPDVMLHLHTDAADEFTQSIVYSYDVRQDVRYLNLQSKVRFTPGFIMKKGGGLPLTELAAYYQAADVHLLSSSGEGFGLPTLQAAASGAVPMASAYSASQELTEGHGEPLPVAEWTENEFGIRRALIDVEKTAARLSKYYENRELLREGSQRARHFAEAYSWERVLNQWDRLLRSIASSHQRMRRPVQVRTQSVEKIAPGMARKGSGVTVSLKVTDREFGRLEASIIADARGRSSDVRLPAAPLPCEVATVRVPRRPGYVGMMPPDFPVFQELRGIFPILNGWALRDEAHSWTELEGVEPRWIHNSEEARYDLAQSVLLLNCKGVSPESILIDAALYGVPCIGPSHVAMQMVLWPELAIDDDKEGVATARGLLTNAARLRRISAQARSLCVRLYAPSEEESAVSLRRLHAEQTRDFALAGE